MAKRKGSLASRSKDNRPKKTKMSAASGKKVVTLNELSWKPVEISGKLDDLEGFYGLEEVEGVDVELNNGKLEFKASESKILSEDSEESSSDSDEEEFRGFDDNPEKMSEKPEKSAKQSPKWRLINVMTNRANQFEILKEDKSEDIDTSNLQWDLDNTPLSDQIRWGLAKLGFNVPTEIQSKAIPEIMSGNDVIGKAATGSGKTLAYGIPILENYQSRGSDQKWPSGLIFAPTRELALQIAKHLEQVSSYMSFPGGKGVVSITGGLAVQKQKRLLETNPAVVVATPGRFLDLLKDQGGKELVEIFKKTETLVLDEADRLIQEGHFQSLEDILDLVGRGRVARRQTLVFSATFQRELMQKLERKKDKAGGSRLASNEDALEMLKSKLHFKSKEPIFIDANPAEAVASQVVETIMECGATEKDLQLYYFLVAYPERSIVFVNSIDTVKRLVPFLKELEIPCLGLHSDMIQKQRLRSLERFKEDKRGVLIATDVAARGLDIPLVQHVIHYHLPRSADIYVHRSGRTARAGNKGMSLVLCSPEEASGPLVKLKRVLYKDNATYKGAMHTFDVDYSLLGLLKKRVKLAKEISELVVEGTHKGKKNAWVKQAVEDLELDVDEDELEELVENGKKKKTNATGPMDLRALRAELKSELEKPVGRRRKYLTAGKANIAQMMLSGKSHGTFLGIAKQSALSTVRE